MLSKCCVVLSDETIHCKSVVISSGRIREQLEHGNYILHLIHIPFVYAESDIQFDLNFIPSGVYNRPVNRNEMYPSNSAS